MKGLLENEKVTEEKIWMKKVQMHEQISKVHLMLSGKKKSHGLPRWLSGKESACSAGDASSIAGSGRPLEKGMATHSSILA